ncbi:MAG TPA: DUF6526 family protein [Verrucomicrobiae bacterium]|jgi:hypothetical protein|nr:DUF6526 family protein [Verrucomicrobiae bacterium]
MSDKPQTFANHGRVDPPFHFFVLPVALITLILVVVHFFRRFNSQDPWSIVYNTWLVVVAIAAVVAIFRIRLYALKAQDRVIRLEERLRLTAVLQEPLRSRISELADAQFIGLRFAPDAELPGLVKRGLDEKLSCKDIKKAIVNWRPDQHRI